MLRSGVDAERDTPDPNAHSGADGHTPADRDPDTGRRRSRRVIADADRGRAGHHRDADTAAVVDPDEYTRDVNSGRECGARPSRDAAGDERIPDCRHLPDRGTRRSHRGCRRCRWYPAQAWSMTSR
jgi:hypothetical protein